MIEQRRSPSTGEESIRRLSTLRQRVSSRQRPISRALAVMFSVVWLAGIIAVYYAYHKPFSPELATNLLASVWQISIGLILVSLAGGIGNRVMNSLPLEPLSRMALQAAIGLGLLGIAGLFLGVLGGFKSLWVSVFVIFGSLVLMRNIKAWWTGWSSIRQIWQAGGRLGRLLGLGSLLVLLLTLTTSLAPPLKFDSLVYHLVLPKLYLDAGQFHYVPEVMFWGMPQLSEMLYTLALAAPNFPGWEQAAVILGWCFGALALVGLLGFVAERLGSRSAWVSIAALTAGFTLSASLAWGYVDWLVILFGWAFLVVLYLWWRDDQPGYLVWMGMFAGMSFGTKYTAGILWLCGLVAICLGSIRKRRGKRIWFNLLCFTAWSGLLAVPWLIKNQLATGNLFYPLFFPSGEMSRLRLDLYQGGEAWGGWLDTILLPFRATIMGFETAPGYSASVGPLLLGLGLAALIGWSRSSDDYRAIGIVSILIVLPSTLVWMIAGRFSNYLLQTRLYFVIFPALAVLAGAGFSRIQRICLRPLSSGGGVRLGRIVGVLILLIYTLNLFELTVYTVRQNTLPVLLSIRSADQYLFDNLGWYASAMHVIRDLPPKAHVLMLWEPRSLYCLPKCQPDEVLDRWLVELHSNTAHYRQGTGAPVSMDDILQSWRKKGYTHLLLSTIGASFERQNNSNYDSQDWQQLDSLLQSLPTPVEFGEAYFLYPLPP